MESLQGRYFKNISGNLISLKYFLEEDEKEYKYEFYFYNSTKKDYCWEFVSGVYKDQEHRERMIKRDLVVHYKEISQKEFDDLLKSMK